MAAIISKHYFIHIFGPISIKLYVKYVSHGEYTRLLRLWRSTKLKLLMTLFQNATPIVFIQCHPNFIRLLATIPWRNTGLLVFLTNDQVLKIVWHYEILKIWVNGKIVNCAMNTVDCRAKRMKIWDSQS